MYAKKTIMPIGKHSGLPIVQLQTDYLLWLLRVPGLQSNIVRAARGELARRRVVVPGDAAARWRDEP
jgi:hypothetical protein